MHLRRLLAPLSVCSLVVVAFLTSGYGFSDAAPKAPPAVIREIVITEDTQLDKVVSCPKPTGQEFAARR